MEPAERTRATTQARERSAAVPAAHGSLNTRIKEFVRPALTNQSIRYAVQEYLAGGARKKDIVDKYGEINNWDVSNVTNMEVMFADAHLRRLR